MSLQVRAETIKALRNAANHLENKQRKGKWIGTLWIGWLRQVADALLLEYTFVDQLEDTDIAIFKNLDGLSEVWCDDELVQWAIKTSWAQHPLGESIPRLEKIPSVKKFIEENSKQGLGTLVKF